MKFILVFITSLTLFISCKSDDNGDSSISTADPEYKYDADDNFVWSALNEWYYFKDEVQNLDSDLKENPEQYAKFLNSYSSANDLFYSLTQEAVIADKYSYMVDDYEELGSGLKTEYSEYGHEYVIYRIGDDRFVGFIRFVFPNSPADIAGLKRGYFFTEINNQELTVNNIEELLDLETYTLELGIVEDIAGQLTIVPLNQQITLNSGSAEISPIWVNKVINYGGQKVGYLCYSKFASDFHSELNQVFQDFKTQGVQELVLDLRYNPGGSVLTAQYLASMIYTTDNTKVVGKIKYNNNLKEYDSELYFTDILEIKDKDFDTVGEEQINSLNLNRIFILTSPSTASASEFIINSLNPYISVVQIGETTVGKNLGSISLYNTPESDYLDKPEDDNEVKIGLQPIVSKVYNSQNESNYSDGFTPVNNDFILEDPIVFEEVRPLGNVEEILFAKALEQICPSCKTKPIEYTSTRHFAKIYFEKDQLQKDFQVLDVRLN